MGDSSNVGDDILSSNVGTKHCEPEKCRGEALRALVFMRDDQIKNQYSNKEQEVVQIPIIVSNSYSKKYYLDDRLNVLPKEVKDTLKIIFVKLTEEIGGVTEVLFDNQEYDLVFKTYKNDDDFNYDEINANYKLSRIEREYAEIFSQVAEFCKFKFNGLV